jgi:hypothetical protein
MRTTEQINSLWELARKRSVDGEVLRRRIAAIGASVVGFCGFLLAIGLGVVVLVFLGGIVVSVGTAALVALWPRLHSFGGDAVAYARDRRRATRGQLAPLWRRGLSWTASKMCRQVQLISPPSCGHRRRGLRGSGRG